MKIDDLSETAVLKVAVGDGAAPNQLKAAAALIQWLPGVLRVSIDRATAQLEILFLFPTEDLLRQIHAMVRLANCEIAAEKLY